MTGRIISPINLFAYLFGFTVCLAMLYTLFFIIPAQCSALEIESGTRLACEIGEGTYIAGAGLLVVTVYTGYQLCRMLFPAWFG